MKDFFILVLILEFMVGCPRDPYPLPVALASLNGWPLGQNGAKLHKNIKK